ncbi:MAG: putative drug exporter of the superfamily [Thermoleophilaceae bacterium]|nr:putative drug exporter of the superfamily [Thermoleophilaceae bacterium]
MIGLARFSIRHPLGVIALWLLLIFGLIVGYINLGDNYNANFGSSDTDSEHAYEILGAAFPDLSGTEAQIVLHATSGKLTDPATKSAIEGMLDQVSQLHHVSDVDDPFKKSSVQTVSDDGTIAFSLVKFNQEYSDLDPESITPLLTTAQKIEGPNLQIEFGGNPIERVTMQQGPGDSLWVGLLAAIVVLLISFGSLLAMGLPIVTALIGLGTGMTIVGLVSNLIDIVDFSTELGVMIGLGVGVDYSLFILTRFREIYRQRNGHTLTGAEQVEVRNVAIELAMDSSGRAVVFAGITVIIALMGMFSLDFEFMNGLAIAMSIAVLAVLLSSLTVLPSLLRLLGIRVGKLSRRRRRDAEKSVVRVGVIERWVGFVQKHSMITALLSGAVVIALAVPALGIRLGSSDAGNYKPDQTTRKAYDLLSEGFGPGFNAPLQLAVELPKADDDFPAFQLAEALRDTDGIESVDRPKISPGRTAASVIAYPSTSPQSAETTDLVKYLRKDVVPGVETNTGAKIFIGGATAVQIDFTKLLAEKLFLFVGTVVLLSALLLLVVFRSFVIPLQAAVMNLMSIGASMGIVKLAFQDGLLPGMTPGPIESFLPVMVFSIVFGLSMDYEVFLISRIHEEWLHKRDHTLAIREGLARTGRVVTAAAAVMVVVFGAFILFGERTPAMFGLGLSVAVLIDAFIIRVVLLPAVLQLIGPITWSFPAWLDWVLPPLAVEPHEDAVNRRPWNIWIKLFWGTLVVLLVAGAIVWIVLDSDNDEKDHPKVVKVLAEEGTVRAKVSAPGSVVDPGSLAVNFPGTGRIKSVAVDTGDQVQKGDVLAVIENAQARADLRAAKAQLSAADVGARSGSAQGHQAQNAVKAARRSLKSSRSVTRATKRSMSSAVSSAKDSERQASKGLKQAKKAEKKACGGRLQDPEAVAACDAAKAAVDGGKKEVHQAKASVKGAKKERDVGSAQQKDAVRAAESGVSSARRAGGVSRAQNSGNGPPISAAEIQVKNARRALNRTALRAPADGKVVSVGGRPGEYIGQSAAGAAPGGAAPSGASAGAGTPSGFVLLTDVDRLEVDASFSQKDAVDIEPGQAANVTLPALDDKKLYGKVVRISPSGAPGDEDTKFVATMSVSRPPSGLRVGQTGVMEVETGQAKDAVYIPTGAVQTTAGRSTAAVMKDGVPRLRRVRIGLQDELTTQILKGIKPDDKVIVGIPKINTDR